MRHATVAATAAALLLLSAAPAAAGGSDDPVPYTVGADGLTLPAGDAFRDGGHVNIRYTTGAAERAAHIHFETLNGQASGAYVGESYLPWSALAGQPPADLCITWVQVEGYNEHFGEGGQQPVCAPDTQPAPEPSPEPSRTTTEPAVPPAVEPPGPSGPDTEAAPPETSSPAEPSEEGAAEEPAVPGVEDETPGLPSGDDAGPAGEDGPATSRPDTSATSGQVVGGMPAAVDAAAPDQGAALAAGDVEASAAADELPRTGAAVAGLAAAAAVLLAAGAVLLVVRRRRRA
ncbi:LPXTG cell wall anchor domain-containing protein [Isoptericola sp. NPDC019693]|uniref:LPXTG cell wall anchor domain-containing protein n=1 Tax=Isoptericola sp. NPDC019693 TaxID=3364009 RepID=UPI00379BFB88